jgi:hypothetical protein
MLEIYIASHIYIFSDFFGTLKCHFLIFKIKGSNELGLQMHFPMKFPPLPSYHVIWNKYALFEF